MKHLLISIATTCIMLSACNTKTTDENPFFSKWDTPFGIPPFQRIDASHYLTAFEVGFDQHNREIDSIAKQPVEPNFKNTIEGLEFSGHLLNNVTYVFFNLTDAETNDSLQAIAEEISPRLSEHDDNIYMNDMLFARVKVVYDNQNKENLTSEQKRVLELYYKNFVRSGALLSNEDKDKLKQVNKDLALLQLKFDSNVLAETNDYALVIEHKEDLEGLPQGVIDAAAEAAAERDLDGKWVITLHNPSWIPFLQYAKNRKLREQVYTAYIKRGDNGNENDNKAIVNKIINLRIEKAKLLGYNTFADYVLVETMANNPENVMHLLQKIWDKATPKALKEVAEMQAIADKEGENIKIEPWDWWYYAEKVRAEKFNLNEEQIKPYFQVDNVRDGAFMVANKLWGISFSEIQDAPVYHPDVKAFEVKDADGKHLSVLFVDYFPRASKQGGAWMNNYRGQYIQNGTEVRPVICNVGNFTKPTQDTPSLLTLDEVETLFHEFGHALHGMLTQCNYPMVSGTNVARDFVELPSQIMEHWATEPDVLKIYAKHYKTGEVIPDSLIAKIIKTGTFNQGFTTTELVAAAILDMKWHMLDTTQEFNPVAFEKNAMQEIGLIPEIAPRYRTSYFRHIFCNDYSAGYYSYLWAEVLDADAFDAFKEKGVFNQEVAAAYRNNILKKGGSVEPMELYVSFRGQEPNPEALLRNRGL